MLPIIQPLTRAEATIVGETWARRARREAELALRFDSLFQALRAHQATPTVVTLAEQTSQDSQAHANKYAEIAKSFDVNAKLESVTRGGPLAPPELTILDKIMYELVLLSCVEETLMGCLMGQIYQHAKHPQIRLTAHIVFQDEIWHSRLGWAHLGNVANQTSVAWLSNHVTAFLAALLDHELSQPDSIANFPKKFVDYGVFDQSRRFEILSEAVNTIILPGFESLGIDVEAGRSWTSTIQKH